MTSDIFDDLFEGLEKMNMRFEQLFSNTDDYDVKTYGYTMVRGPDGVPHIREFGNAVDDQHRINNEGVREPLSDVTSDGDKIRVTVELPGVSKEDIRIEGEKDSIRISVDTESRRFEKELDLPEDVDPDSASAQYNNGILEITLDTVDKKTDVKLIPIA